MGGVVMSRATTPRRERLIWVAERAIRDAMVPEADHVQIAHRLMVDLRRVSESRPSA